VARSHPCLKRQGFPARILKIDRDINAARNILTIGKIGPEQPKLTPVGDEASTNDISPKQALSMKQEATQLVGE